MKQEAIGNGERGQSEKRVRVRLSPSGALLTGRSGMNYAELLLASGANLPMDCGGRGTCGKCRIRVVDQLPAPADAETLVFSEEELAAGWRLACMQPVADEAHIEVPPNVGDLQAKGGADVEIAGSELDSGIRSVRISLPASRTLAVGSREAFLRDNLGGSNRLSVVAARDLSRIPLDGTTEIEAVLDDATVVAILSGAPRSVLAGAAIDIGTTTLAVYIHDLETGRRIGAATGGNPQQRFGADVISRIGYARRDGTKAIETMHLAVIEGISELIERACRDAGLVPTDLWRFVVVGNPTMLHLFLGISPVGIDHAPYVAAFDSAAEVSAGALGLSGRDEARVHTLPSVSAYVGADLVAGILATQLDRTDDTELLVDVGTNGEMVLSMRGRRMACSTAAGPAFEGATISQGMVAVDGAIDAVRVVDDELECRTIGGKAPIGICGAGLLSAVGGLLNAGLIDETGRLVRSGTSLDALLSGTGREARIRLTSAAPHVFLTQADIREFQLAKAAIRAGMDALLEEAGLRAEELSRLLIAGALGSHLEVAAGLRTGLFPALPSERILAVGNTAGQGAALALLDRRQQRRAEEVVACTEVVELSRSASFRDHYLARMGFSPTPAAG